MEQVSFKNSPPVCENSLATEVVNQISNANFSMSSCRIKNGLVNGVADDVCTSNNNNTRARLMGKGDSVKPDMDISKDKHGQYKTQTCMENSTVFRKSVETSVTHSSDISSLTNEIGCSYMDPSTSKGKAKRKTKTKVNHDEHLKDVSDIDSTISKSSSETKPISLVNCDSAESNKSLVTDMRKLNLEHSVSDNSGDRVETVANMVVDVNAFQVSENFSAITFVQYESEEQMPLIMKIIQKDLSEPYSIYTYRYFIHNWPKLCFLAMCDNTCVGAIVCKLDYHRKATKRGYIAMLAVDQHYRNRKIGSTLVWRAIRQMIAGNADEVVLETEVTNKSALRLYDLLGFVKDKRLLEQKSMFIIQDVAQTMLLCKDSCLEKAMCDNTCVGAIVCKLDYHRKATKRGYIAMLAVDQHYRNRQIGSTLVRRAIRQMIAGNADEVVLETEVTNKSALRLYELLGFVKDKRLFRYYLNGVDALRLKLWLR